MNPFFVGECVLFLLWMCTLLSVATGSFPHYILTILIIPDIEDNDVCTFHQDSMDDSFVDLVLIWAFNTWLLFTYNSTHQHAWFFFLLALVSSKNGISYVEYHVSVFFFFGKKKECFQSSWLTFLTSLNIVLASLTFIGDIPFRHVEKLGWINWIFKCISIYLF